MRLARGTALLLMAVLLTGCGARWAYRQGQTEARRGFALTGILIPTRDAESFLRASADAGLLRILH